MSSGPIAAPKQKLGKKIKAMTPGIPHSARVRAYLAGAVVTLGLTGVAYKAWGLQVEGGEHFAELAAKQHAMTIAIPAPRGDVVDALGRPLAVSADTDSIWADPQSIADVTDTAAKLAAITGEDPRALEAKLGTDKKFVWLDRHISPDLAAKIAGAKLKGIELAKEPRRWYPNGSLAGPLVGRADIDGKGLDGIELAMNDLLTGKRGSQKALRDARGRRMFADGVASSESGATVQLTIDRSVQAIADRALADQVVATKSKNGVAVVLDVATGKVIALSTYPTYDPNTPGQAVLAGRNRPVTDIYEAGSVMKVFSIAAALDVGVVTPETGFDLNWGTYTIGGGTVHDVEHEPYGNVGEILKWSSNVGASKIAARLGRDELYAHLKRYGFGAKTGIELPGEASGKLRAGDTWRDFELATISFGMGLSVTPIQVAAAFAAIGAGGKYHAPRIVEQVTDGDGTVLYAGVTEEREIMQPKTAATMMDMMRHVFEKGPHGGTAKTLVIEGFECAGKTGTAHKWDPATHHYAEDRYLSSFAGLAPGTDPRLAIVVMIDDPQGGDHYGSKVAGPVFSTIASESLRYLGVPGSAPPVPLAPAAPAYVVPYRPLTPEMVTKTFAHTIFDPHEWKAVKLPAGATAMDVPRFLGMGYAQVVARAREAGVAIDPVGSGRVIAQDPLPGTAVAGTKVKVTFGEGHECCRVSPR